MRSLEHLWDLRLRVVHDMRELDGVALWEPHPLDAPDAFTCDGCTSRLSCPFVYDPYNTDGDCLGGK